MKMPRTRRTRRPTAARKDTTSTTRPASNNMAGQYSATRGGNANEPMRVTAPNRTSAAAGTAGHHVYALSQSQHVEQPKDEAQADVKGGEPMGWPEHKVRPHHALEAKEHCQHGEDACGDLRPPVVAPCQKDHPESQGDAEEEHQPFQLPK